MYEVCMLLMQILITIVASAIAKSYVDACPDASFIRVRSRYVKYSPDENLQKTILIFKRVNVFLGLLKRHVNTPWSSRLFLV